MPATHSAAGSPARVRNGLIVYTGNDSQGRQQIFIVSPDGIGARQLTQPTAPLYPSANVPVWSPDGNRIAFWSGFEAFFGQVWIMRADGSGRRALTSCPPPTNCDVPAWSPDGRFVLFDGTPLLGLAAGTWVMDADGKHQRLLLPFPYGAGRRPWQPVPNGRSSQ